MLLRPKENALAVTQLLLKNIDAKISYDSLKKALYDHPEYPSLLAISDVLNEYHIHNEAYQIKKEEYNVDDLLFPFIAHVNNNGGMFMLIHNIKDGQVTFSDEKSKKSIIPEKDFIQKWSGIALYATITPNSSETRYYEKQFLANLKTLGKPLLILTLLSTLLLGLNFQNSIPGYYILLLVKLLGVGIGVLLLAHSIDANNPFVKNLCGLGSKNNCNAILKSDAAKVNEWLSWSEVGFFYFTGSFLALYFNPSLMPYLLWLNLLSLPYTIWSIGYQYRQKNWCVLCCSVQVLLWVEFIVGISSGKENYTAINFNITAFIQLFLSFIIPVMAWFLLKPQLTKSAEYNPLKQQLKKFKYDQQLFNHALTNQAKYAVPDNLMPVVLGNPQAETIITMVSNPFCGPCAKAHAFLDNWLATRSDVQLKVIFTTADHDDDQRTKVSRHVSALSQTKDETLLANALNDWYAQNQKKYDEWAKRYPITIAEEMADVTAKQKAWCDMAEIQYTPTILINGYKLPEPYQLEDIKYLVY